MEIPDKEIVPSSERVLGSNNTLALAVLKRILELIGNFGLYVLFRGISNIQHGLILQSIVFVKEVLISNLQFFSFTVFNAYQLPSKC